jgi:hypothetical protein
MNLLPRNRHNDRIAKLSIMPPYDGIVPVILQIRTEERQGVVVVFRMLI